MPKKDKSQDIQSEELAATKKAKASEKKDLPVSAPVAPKPHEFTAGDFSFLSENEHFRYLQNSSKVGHALIKKTKEGDEVALQFRIPQEAGSSAPTVRPLENIEAIERYGMHRFRARTPNLTEMYASRFIDLEFGDSKETEKFQIACFSPAGKNKKEPFWGGSEKETPLFRTDMTATEKAELEKELKEIKPTTKGGKELVIDPPSVKIRDGIKTRTPSQNTVMEESAKDAYEGFLDTMMSELHPEMKQRLKRAIEAPLRDAFFSNYRPEWLHAEGFSLTPMSIDPQRKDNLGAAPKWANTEMMILERIAKWFALNIPDFRVKIKPIFEMLLDTELVKKIHFEVTIEDKERFIKLLQNIDPFKKHHLFRKASDIAQGTAIAYSLLHGITPEKQQIVKNTALRGSISSTATLSSSSALPLTTASSAMPHPLSLDAPKEKPEVKEKKTKSAFPTHFKYEKSVVQILTTMQEFNYDEPWSAPRNMSASGTGLVVAHEGKKYIVTNAHCVENAVLVRVRLANDRKKKYEAIPRIVAYQCDLALLEVTHPEFLALTEPLELGDMVNLRTKVMTVGFPKGGTEISLSKGIVSRIEVRSYCESGLDMLQVQIDAAVNSGNSGGPVFSADKVVGVAFQSYGGHQGLSYMIPIPIVKHFLAEAFSSKKYRGFPILPIMTQPLENPSLREHYHMKEEQTGVRISRIDFLSDAYAKLKVDDILLEIDDMPISNEETVNIPGVGNCIDYCHVTHMKYIGDTVKLKVLRKNNETKEPEILTMNVTLDTIPHETEKVPAFERDKAPTYYISSGVSFVPLTRNYMESKGSELEEYCDIDGLTLVDVAKKTKDEEFVVINEVLDCEATQGYDDYVNVIVKEVNGKAINNLRDVVEAIENNREPLHYIATKSRKMVIKNMSKEEHAVLLKRYHIHHDRSEDLRMPTSLGLEKLFEEKSEPVKLSAKRPEKHVTFAESVKKEEEESKTEEDENMSMPALPGVKNYLAKINELEDRYKDMSEEDHEKLSADYESTDDEEYVPSDQEEENLSEEEIDLEDENEEVEEVVEETSVIKMNEHRLFSHKRKRNDEDEEPKQRKRM